MTGPSRSAAVNRVLMQQAQLALATAPQPRPDLVPPGLDPWRQINRLTRAGVLFVALLSGTVGLWAATVPFAGAVIASGRIVVETDVRKIQHPTGGIVADIRVKDGDHVTAGDILFRLDDTNARATLALIDVELTRLTVRRARLIAERDGAATFDLPPGLPLDPKSPTVIEAMASEGVVFHTRREAARGQVSQLRERIDQSRREIEGVKAQLEAKQTQKMLIDDELKGVQQLYTSNLVAQSRLTSLQREASRLLGEEGSNIAEIARINGRISETELQIIQVSQDTRRGVSEELRDVEGKIADLAERRIAAADLLQRVVMRAPQEGIVHQNTLHTIGGVIAPGEQVMLLVPETDGLVIEARIDPTMIDRVHINQPVNVRFTAFDTSTTPTLTGRVEQVGADLTTDPKSGASYYEARIHLDRSEITKLGGKTLVPGMPAESFIQTGTHTPLAYILKPFDDQLTRAFRY